MPETNGRCSNAAFQSTNCVSRCVSSSEATDGYTRAGQTHKYSESQASHCLRRRYRKDRERREQALQAGLGSEAR